MMPPSEDEKIVVDEMVRGKKRPAQSDNLDQVSFKSESVCQNPARIDHKRTFKFSEEKLASSSG